MPEEEPVCDCGDEPPDPCEDNETCCNGTTCVANSTFQTDSNNCGGCNNVCPAGQTCVAGGCTGGGGDIGCCTEYTCINTPETTPFYVATGNFYSSTVENCEATCFYNCFFDPTCNDQITNYWTPNACSCNNVFLICEGFQVNEPGWQPPPPPYAWILNPNVPNNSCNPGCICPTIGAACNNYGEPQEEPCYAPGPAPLSYDPASQLALKEEPCSQEECEAHVSTWMADPIGKPNEEGLYKVNWVLLDGCPGLCCSDQPTQPEFVEASTLVDAPCKCGCD